MTFKWTYLFVAAVMVAAIVIALLSNSGELGDFGGGTWIGVALVFATAATFVLLARRSRPQPASVARHSDEAFVGYPKDHVLGIFDTRPQAMEALPEFRRAGFNDADIALYAGAKGSAALDSEGTVHGLGAIAERTIEHVMADTSDLEGYDAAVRRGGVVIAVRAPEQERRTAALHVFEAHGGHDVYFYGAMVTERLIVGQTRTVPGAGSKPQDGDHIDTGNQPGRLSA